MEQALCRYFGEVTDPRSARNQKHPFITLIGTSLIAVLAGLDSFVGIQDFVEAHLEDLSQYFFFPNGTASHDTYQRFWSAISPDDFVRSFQCFTESLATITGDFINIDGKTIRHSGKFKNLHIVSAWCQANQLALAQVKVDNKSNEITAIPELLGLLDLHDRIITIDGIGAQRQICQNITDGGGDYIIALKKNQKTLFEDVSLFLQDDQRHEMIFEECDKGHGRIEQRIAAVAHDINWLQKNHDWPGLQGVGQVKSRVIRGGKEMEETRYYISSMRLSAEMLQRAVRGHWEIENKLHWRLDVVFNEDKGCIRNDNAAENMDILRKWALNALHRLPRKPGQSIKSLMRRNTSIKHLVQSIRTIFHA